jgi:AraC family transcriptional activator of tynA and feaB
MLQRRDGIAWDWTPDIWPRKPKCGRWRHGHDPPSKVIFLDISTNAAPPLEVYSFWNEGFWNERDSHKQKERANRPANANRSVSNDGSLARDRPETALRGRQHHYVSADGGGIDLSLVISSERRQRSNNEHGRLTNSGGFFLYNASDHSRVAGEAGDAAHLLLRREIVEAALGGPMPPIAAMAEAMFRSRLTLVLRDQMLLVARTISDLNQAQLNFLLHQTARLALFAIEGSVVSDSHPSANPVRAALFTAAQRYIERHFADFDLDVGRIASNIGASRATLYRAFADHGLTVAEAIREKRLARAEALLKAGPMQVSIDAIAETCGFAHTRSFQRAFRMRFGVNPTEFRPRNR